MKKLLLFTALLSTSLALFCPAFAPRQAAPSPAPANALAAKVTPQATPAAATGLNDQLLMQALAAITATLTGPDAIDTKIEQYRKLIPVLKATKVNSLSPSKQTVIRDTLKVLLEELDTLISENEYWLYDTQQTSMLKECRAEVASLITKFSGYWYGLPAQMYSYYKTHWRAPLKLAAIVLPVVLGYKRLTK